MWLYSKVVDHADISFGMLGLPGISFTFVNQFNNLISGLLYYLMDMAIESEAAKKSQ